ncbi:DNA repair protein RecO [Desulfogranum japonicum]|uniref:DNA repair protein RecO n=1 Tax=Desulfogranum japonicum TaxID=231447 RepID=UPI00042011F2|nr:DNA repair protein RecO [Desulfogranum japonicum]
MQTCTTCCFVLKTTDHGESDKIITCFCRDRGKIAGIAKGAKRSKQRFVNKLEPFTKLNIVYSQPRKGTLLFFSEAELVQAYLPLRQFYERYLAASFITELILKFTRENDSDEGIFALLDWAFSTLTTEEKPLKVVALFHVRFMGLLGYQPELKRCFTCGQPVRNGQTYRLQPSGGAITCSTCTPYSRGYDEAQISVQTLKFLHLAQEVQLGRLNRLKMPASAIQQTIETLHRFSLHLLQQDITGWKGLKSLFPLLHDR